MASGFHFNIGVLTGLLLMAGIPAGADQSDPDFMEFPEEEVFALEQAAWDCKGEDCSELKSSNVSDGANKGHCEVISGQDGFLIVCEDGRAEQIFGLHDGSTYRVSPVEGASFIQWPTDTFDSQGIPDVQIYPVTPAPPPVVYPPPPSFPSPILVSPPLLKVDPPFQLDPPIFVTP